MTKKILIIEDDKVLNEMYSLKFSNESYEVKSAYDGIDGLSQLVDFNPDIILLDLMMPSMNGFETLESIKFQTNSKCKIIIFTNIVDEDKINKAMKIGADDYLIKADTTPKDVFEKVEKYFCNNKDEIYINPGLNTFKIKNPNGGEDISVEVNIKI